MRTCPLCKTTYPDEVERVPGGWLRARRRARQRLDATAPSSRRPARCAVRVPVRLRHRRDATSGTPAPPPPVGPGVRRADPTGPAGRPAHPRRAMRRRPSAPRPGAHGPAPHAWRSPAVAWRRPPSWSRNDFSALLSSRSAAAARTDRAARVAHRPGARLVPAAEVIGRGGMGCVYRAEHVKLGRDVALKLLREDYAQRRDAVARFFQEARAVNLIRHRNIVDVIDYVELDDGDVFIIMELLAGQSLGRLMRAAASSSAARSASWRRSATAWPPRTRSASSTATSSRTTSSSAARPDGGDLVKILDFGVAKLLDKHDSDPDLTAAGSVIGTPAYMSPGAGRRPGGRPALRRLLARRDHVRAVHAASRCSAPARSASTCASTSTRRRVPPQRDARRRATSTRGIEALILRCLEKSPDARYQSAARAARRPGRPPVGARDPGAMPSDQARSSRRPRARGDEGVGPAARPGRGQAAAAAVPRVPHAAEPDAEGDQDGERRPSRWCATRRSPRHRRGRAAGRRDRAAPRDRTAPPRARRAAQTSTRRDAAWNQLPARAVAYGTPSPYDPPAIRRAAPLVAGAAVDADRAAVGQDRRAAAPTRRSTR